MTSYLLRQNREERKPIMSLGRILVSLLKGKALAVIGTSIVLTGGVTAVMAATPTGQHLIQTVVPTQSATPAATSHKDDQDSSSHRNSTNPTDNQNGSSHPNATATDHNNPCPGLADAQRLAANFSLNTAAGSGDLDAICTLHTGTFKGIAPNGQVVLFRQVLGYGEIEQLLTYVRDLASHDHANTTGKLTSGNVRVYLAAALEHCGTTPLATCVKREHLPDFQPDPTVSSSKEDPATPTSHANGNGTSIDNHNSDNKNAWGKPINTPTAHS